MFWDKIAFIYDLFENVYNRKVYQETGIEVSKNIDANDVVLECACGTGAISIHLASVCRKLIATDFSVQMLNKAKKKLRSKQNVVFETADITDLKYDDNTFDVVVAGNVIHLLPDPRKAMNELERVCKSSGKIIIPTYINKSSDTSRLAVKFLEALGVDFKSQFDQKSYELFFENMGYKNVVFETVEGRMPCCIAVITLSY